MLVLGYIIGGFITYIFHIYCWSNITNKKIRMGNYKLYLGLMVWIVLGTLLNIFAQHCVKMIIMCIILYFMAYYIFFHDFKTSIILSFISQFIIIISEMFFVFGSSMFIDIENLSSNMLGNVAINVSIFIIGILIVISKVPKKVYRLCKTSIDHLKENRIIKFTLLMMIVSVLLTVISYIKLDRQYILLINSIVAILYIVILFHVLRIQNKYQEISEKYTSSITTLKEYEKMIDKYRIINHESDAELKRILGMLLQKKQGNQKVIQHIKAIVKVNENNKIMKKTAKIPEGGLRATLYTKMCDMEENNIKYNLIIASEIKPSELMAIAEQDVLDICNIIGVYIDNAIEAVKSLNFKHLVIELYKEDNNLCISVENNFAGFLEIDKFDIPGYTTKGKTHGYGLALVKEIVDNNNKLFTSRILSKNIIKHVLGIKIK